MKTTILAVLLFVVGLVLIIKGGDFFVDGSSWIAEKSGIPKFIIGATIVSIGTTMPEMITSIVGTAEGQIGLAIGNAIGSVTANTAMILAISIIAIPAVIKRKDYWFKSILLMGITLLLFLFLLNQKMGIIEGIVCLLMIVVFIAENIHASKVQSQVETLVKPTNDEKMVEESKEENSSRVENFYEQKTELDLTSNIENVEEDSKERNPKLETFWQIFKFIFGAAAIYFGSVFLVDSGTTLATKIGISEAVIGLTLVAIGTSLPELVTTITAIIKKQSSLSLGNIVGANIIDMAVILPVCSFIAGGTLIPDTTQTSYLDLPVCLIVMMIAFIPSLIRGKFSRWQGILMLTIYIAYLVILFTNAIPFQVN